MPINQEELQPILIKAIDNKKIFGASYALKHHGDLWFGTAGNIKHEQPYFIASTTKLFTTAIILYLESKNKLSLDDTIDKFLGNDILDRILTYKDHDFSNLITIEQLLSHTSGIPDYFQGRDSNGQSLEDSLKSGFDQSWSFEQAIRISKSIRTTFAPGTKGKALYSDTNYQLLGRIIEIITNKSYAANCEALICTPLNLNHTYVFEDPHDQRPLPLYYKSKILPIPKAMASFGPDGGIVSTNRDMLIFIESFFTGELFPKEYLGRLQKWNKIFYPLQSGIGIQRFKLPWIFDPTGAVPELIGHSGLSGALAFHAPSEDLYIVGTVNQVAYPSLSFNTGIKLIRKLI